MVELRLIDVSGAAALKPAGRWLLLSKSPELEAACEAALGRDERVDTGPRLQALAESVREAFTSEIGRIGKRQADVVGWLSSGFAWKQPAASDLFLLSCYRLLIREVAKAEASGPGMIILVDDPWVFEDCRADAALARTTRFVGRGRLWLAKASALAAGAAARALWTARTLLNWRRQSVGGVAMPQPDKPACFLYSMPHERCFRAPDSWDDAFLPGLDELLERGGFSVRRLVPTGAFGFEAEISRRSAIAHPLIEDLSLSSLFAAIGARWRAVDLDGYALAGVAMPKLAERELWDETAHARMSDYRLFWDCLRSFLRRQKPHAIIYPYEGQPWEKLINAAASGTATITIAYEADVMPRFNLAYWHGPESPSDPLPLYIIASGPRQRELLIGAGNPPERTLVGGCLRFSYLAATRPASQPSTRQTKPRVLVLGTHSGDLTRGVIHAVRSAFPDGGAAEGIAILFRPHPTAPAGVPRQVPGWKTVTGDLRPQLTSFDLIIMPGSAAGLEASFLGVPVLFFLPSAALDPTDVGNLVPDGYFEYASAAQMRDKVRACLKTGRAATGDIERIREGIFSAVDGDLWLRILGAGAGISR